MPIAEVLIVVDDKQTVKNLKLSLEKLGFNICGLTNNTTEALRLASAAKPDVILIDTKLNEFEDGIEAARTITGAHNVPHIFISKETDEKTLERSKTTNPYGFLLKPVHIRDLNACLRLALSRFDSEKKLMESEERYFRLAEHAKDMIYRVSLVDNAYDYINYACIDITGYTPQEFYSRPGLLQSIMHPDIKNSYKTYINKLVKGDAPPYFEFMIVHKSGATRWLNQRNVLLRNKKNVPVMLEGIVNDVSERRKYEEMLEMQKEEYKLIFEAIPAMVVVKDWDNKIIKVNNKASEFIGFPINEMEGKNIGEFFPGEPEKFLLEDKKVIASGKPSFGITEEHKTRSGDVNILKYDKFPYFDTKGKVNGVIIMAQNVTNERHYEQRLLELEKKNSVLINTIPDLLFEFDNDGKYLDYRASRPENLIKTPEEFLGKKVTEILPEKVSSEYMKCLKKVNDTGEMQVYEYTLFIGNEDKDFEARFVKSGSDKILAIIRDITSRKAVEDSIKQSLAEKEILLKEIHHRVKNNLQIISSLLKLQSKYVTDKDALMLLKESQNRVQSMSLIHQKLYQTRDFAQIEFQEYILTVTMHLQHSFGILADRVRVNIQAKGIIMSIDNAIPAGLIINELVSNSLKYAFPGTRKGEIDIIVTSDKEKGEYFLTVKDNGIGITGGLDLKKAGSFGLNLVNMLVGQMGGSIEMVNEKGLEFRISFKSSEYLQRA